MCTESWRVAQNEWREISTQTSSGFRLTSQVETPERILLKDDSRNMPLELDLAARKARQRYIGEHELILRHMIAVGRIDG